MKQIKCKTDKCTYFVNDIGGVEYIETNSGIRYWPFVWENGCWNRRCLSYSYLRRLDKAGKVRWN